MKPLRSFLFVPGDSEKKQTKARASNADAVILDLEDSVAVDQKPAARAVVAAALDLDWRASVWVRINPLDSGMVADDLAICRDNMPDGIMLPKAGGPDGVAALSALLDAFDPGGHIKILPIATETAASPFALGDYIGADLPRLWGLTWGAEDLATDLGATGNKDASGAWYPVFEHVRSLTLLAAKGAGVFAIDTLHADFRDADGMARTSARSFAEGFTGRLAIHPGQVDPINDAYCPSPEAVDHARRVVAEFAANPGAGVVAIDGKMVDIPHFKQAEAILSMAEASGLSP